MPQRDELRASLRNQRHEVLNQLEEKVNYYASGEVMKMGSNSQS